MTTTTNKASNTQLNNAFDRLKNLKSNTVPSPAPSGIEDSALKSATGKNPVEFQHESANKNKTSTPKSTVNQAGHTIPKANATAKALEGLSAAPNKEPTVMVEKKADKKQGRPTKKVDPSQYVKISPAIHRSQKARMDMMVGRLKHDPGSGIETMEDVVSLALDEYLLFLEKKYA